MKVFSQFFSLRKEGFPVMTRRDRILIAGVIALAAILGIVFYIKNRVLAPDTPPVVTATIDGQLYGAWALTEDIEVDIDTQYGHNHLTIKDGHAQVTDADCPDAVCVRHRAVSRVGQSILCLPHKVAVTVVGGEPAVDAEV